MSNRNDYDRSDFLISYELLRLIEWLCKHEQKLLKKIVERFVKRGLTKRAELQEDLDNVRVQQSIVEFLTLFDSLLQDSLNDSDLEDFLQRSLVPAIDNVDRKVCTASSISSSVAKVTNKSKNLKKRSESEKGEKDETPKERFCKELLKNWSPAKKDTTVH